MYIRDYLLQSNDVKHFKCSKNLVPLISKEFIIIHYTASTNLDSTINFLKNKNNKVSAHIVIGRMGEIVQLVPFNIQAWHAGVSEYKGFKFLNQYSIGIELINAGKLHYKNNNFYTYYNSKIPKNQIISEKKDNEALSFWQTFTKKQITSLIKVCKFLRVEYPQINEIIGHSDITSRKIDPGKAFPWDKVLKATSKLIIK